MWKLDTLEVGPFFFAEPGRVAGFYDRQFIWKGPSNIEVSHGIFCFAADGIEFFIGMTRRRLAH